MVLIGASQDYSKEMQFQKLNVRLIEQIRALHGPSQGPLAEATAVRLGAPGSAAAETHVSTLTVCACACVSYTQALKDSIDVKVVRGGKQCMVPNTDVVVGDGEPPPRATAQHSDALSCASGNPRGVWRTGCVWRTGWRGGAFGRVAQRR